MPDYLRDAIQRMLDEAGDGWSVHQFVVAMGLERLDESGEVESTPWVWCPPAQPGWQSVGLLAQGIDLLQAPTDDDD